MVISFLEGSKLIESGVGPRVYKELNKLIRAEDKLIAYFSCHGEFMELCEWEIRKLRAAYPKKDIEVVRLAEKGDSKYAVPAVRYTSYVELTEDELGTARSVGEWMVDRSNYVFCYIDKLLMGSKERQKSIEYALRKLGQRCLNFCSSEAMISARECIPTLPKWERRALEGKLAGERKLSVASDLGVSLTTVRTYEVAAQHNVARRVHKAEQIDRTCAVLGFSMQELPKKYEQIIHESFHYLIFSCQISCFALPEKPYKSNEQISAILRRLKRTITPKIEIKRMKAIADRAEVPLCNDSAFFYEQKSKKYVVQGLEERKAMIDVSDIVFCDVESVRRSGLNYAAKKRIPVINIIDFL